MKKIDLFYGFILGLFGAFIGVFVFLKVFLKTTFFEGINQMQAYGYSGKVITLGAILNILFFFILLKKNKELMARGVVLATIILALLTQFL